MSKPVSPGRWNVDGFPVEVRIPARPKHGPDDRVILVAGEQLSFETFLYEAHGHGVRRWSPGVVDLVRRFFHRNEDVIFPNGMGSRMLAMVEDIARHASLDDGLCALDMTMTHGAQAPYRLQRWHGQVMEQVAAENPACPVCRGNDLRRGVWVLICNACSLA